MIKYTSSTQLRIEGFETPLQCKLDPDNRWVKLGDTMPWDRLVAVYYRKMNSHQGAPGVDARVAIGALIVKHKLNLSDAETIECIRENMYIQYFLGLSTYSYQAVFDSSLFVHIRKRLGVTDFDEMTLALMDDSDPDKKDKSVNNPDTDSGSQKTSSHDKVTHQGDLKMDATIGDAAIAYPTDIDLLHAARSKSEELIDLLCKALNQAKPRTYRQEARTAYLNIIKKKSKTNKIIRKGIREQQQYLRRNLKYLSNLLDRFPASLSLFSRQQRKYYFVIQLVYWQQSEMYQNKTHTCSDRIVSIHQPHVRPMVRGKSKAKVEFGAKIGVSIVRGYARIEHLSWDAYNEQEDLKLHIENYYLHQGFYPKRVLADQIYFNKNNRAYLKEDGIELVGKPLGRPTRESKEPHYKKALAKAMAQRNEIEGCFGTAKSRYRMNNIRAKLTATAASWIACGYFVMNLMKFARELLFVIVRIHILAIRRLIERSLLMKKQNAKEIISNYQKRALWAGVVGRNSAHSFCLLKNMDGSPPHSTIIMDIMRFLISIVALLLAVL